MNYIADTQAVLWYVESDPQLSRRAKAIIDDPLTQLYISVVSLWEIAIKVSINKLSLTGGYRAWIDDMMMTLRPRLIPVTIPDLDVYSSPPLHHRDPYDRLIIAQATFLKFPVISSDGKFDLYTTITRIW